MGRCSGAANAESPVSLPDLVDVWFGLRHFHQCGEQGHGALAAADEEADRVRGAGRLDRVHYGVEVIDQPRRENR